MASDVIPQFKVDTTGVNDLHVRAQFHEFKQCGVEHALRTLHC
jgi:hypothetical protein